jgi:hypothetical protein
VEYDEVQWETLDMVCALVGLIESLLADLDPDDPCLVPLEGWWFSGRWLTRPGSAGRQSMRWRSGSR